MGLKCLQIATVFCATGACALFVTSLNSTSWMMNGTLDAYWCTYRMTSGGNFELGCLKYENIIEAEKSLAKSETIKTSFDLNTKIMKGEKYCIHQGIIKFSVHVGSYFNSEYLIPVYSLPVYQIFGTFAIILAIGSLVVGVVLLINSACHNDENYTDRSSVSNFARKAMIALIFAGIFGLSGIIIYSAKSAPDVSNPLKFAAHFTKTEMGTKLQELGVKFADAFLSTDGREKRDINFDDLKLLDGLTPVYGYAFVLGWLAVILTVVSIVLSAHARKHLLGRPLNDTHSVKL